MMGDSIKIQHLYVCINTQVVIDQQAQNATTVQNVEDWLANSQRRNVHNVDRVFYLAPAQWNNLRGRRRQNRRVGKIQNVCRQVFRLVSGSVQGRVTHVVHKNVPFPLCSVSSLSQWNLRSYCFSDRLSDTSFCLQSWFQEKPSLA